MSLQTYIIAFGNFLNWYIIPFIFAFGFLMFLWGMFKFFFLNGASAESRENGKTLALWSVAAFVVGISLWGIVNVLLWSFGIGAGTVVCPDYFPTCK